MPGHRQAPGGGASYAGFEYQFLATAWLALKIIFDQRLSESVTVEPATEEDLAVVLKSTSAADVGSLVSVPVGGRRLDIQIKRRAGLWSTSAFRVVLQGEQNPPGKRGPKPRTRAIDSLSADPATQYLLVTNAQVMAELDSYVVKQIGQQSTATTLPITPVRPDAARIAPRVGILHEMTSEHLILDIEKLLRRHGHVPESRVENCRRHLADEVKLRVLGEASRIWDRAAIEKIIVNHEGRLDESRTIVLPIVASQIESQLLTRHCLLLTGGPGLGKTELAQELARRLHRSADAFEIVRADEGVAGIRKALEAQGSTVFLIEDPWGHDRLVGEAQQWANELPKLFRKAGPTKRFIVVSRAGVRHEAFGTKPIPGFTDAEFVLKPEHYTEDHRREMMRLRMLEAEPWQRDWVARYEKQWIHRLTVPLALDHFASDVRQAANETDLKIEELLRVSNVDALSGLLAAEIRARGTPTVAGALLLWAVHHADERVTAVSVRESRELARAGKYASDIDPEKTLDGFVAAGWFRPADIGFVAHPTALTGIESLLVHEAGTADDILGAFLSGLIERGAVKRAFAIVKHLELRPTAASDAVRTKIEALLLSDFMTATGYAAYQSFSQLAEHAVSTHPPVLVVRALKRERNTKGFHGVGFWHRPEVPPEHVELIGKSPEALAFARHFVAEVLPGDMWDLYSADKLVPFFQQFGWNFGPEFSTAAEQALLNYDRNARLDFLAEAAILGGATNLSALTDAVLVAEDVAVDLWDQNAEERERAAQCELDGEHSSHLDEEGSELISPVRRAGEVIVTARRRAEGWQWLSNHPRVEDLLRYWVKAIDGGAKPEEIAAFDQASRNARPLFWEALANTGDMTHLDVLLAEGSRALIGEVRFWIKDVARLVDLRTWKSKVMPVVQKLPLSHRIEMAGIDGRGDNGQNRLALLKSALSHLEIEVQNLCETVAAGKSWRGRITPAHVSALRHLAKEGRSYHKGAAVVALATLKEEVSETIAALRASDDTTERQAALFATVVSGVDVRAAIIAALEDRDHYQVRRMALSVLADSQDADAWSRILAMHSDPSAPVRAACAEAIGRANRTDGVPVLLELLRDRRDRRGSTLMEGNWPEYHVARAAAEALCEFDLDANAVGRCLGFLQDQDRATDADVEVYHQVMNALSEADDDRLVPFFVRLLGSDWHVSGQKDSGYPLRFTAAMCLVTQLERFPAKRALVDPGPVATAALHNDPRLAGPALVILGLMGVTAEIVSVARAAITTPERALIIKACLASGNSSAKQALEEAIGAKHPARALLDLAGAATPTAKDWDKWLVKNPAFESWLAAIQDTKEMNSWLRFALGRRFPDNAPAGFDSVDRLEGVVPQPIGILSLRSMTGGE